MYSFTQTACFPLDHEVGRAVPHPTWPYASFLTDFPPWLCLLAAYLVTSRFDRHCTSVRLSR
jgi:hypothetical protein